MKARKGIILAGGSGTRMYPASLAISKQLLPVYDKPMIYYALATLMLADIRDILIISTPQDIPRFESLLKDGHLYGLNLSYCVQPAAKGIGEAFILAKSFIADYPCALALGDNFFYGHDFPLLLANANRQEQGATVFSYHVNDPERYGVVEFNSDKKVISIEEKPQLAKSNYALTGLYFYDNQVVDIAEHIRPSARGELEITDINAVYLNKQQLHMEIMRRGFTWLDMGTHDSLLEAGQFIATIEKRQGLKIACIEEIAYRKNWISREDLEKHAELFANNTYGKYLHKILHEPS